MSPATPEAWTDVKNLLQEDYYISLFITRALGRDSQTSFIKSVAAAIKSNEDHVQWVQAWIKLALADAPDENNYSRPHPIPEDDAIALFVKVSWMLYNKDTEGAYKVVNQHRKEYNCTEFFNLPPRRIRWYASDPEEPFLTLVNPEPFGGPVEHDGSHAEQEPTSPGALQNMSALDVTRETANLLIYNASDVEVCNLCEEKYASLLSSVLDDGPSMVEQTSGGSETRQCCICYTYTTSLRRRSVLHPGKDQFSNEGGLNERKHAEPCPHRRDDFSAGRKTRNVARVASDATPSVQASPPTSRKKNRSISLGRTDSDQDIPGGTIVASKRSQSETRRLRRYSLPSAKGFFLGSERMSPGQQLAKRGRSQSYDSTTTRRSSRILSLWQSRGTLTASGQQSRPSPNTKSLRDPPPQQSAKEQSARAVRAKSCAHDQEVAENEAKETRKRRRDNRLRDHDQRKDDPNGRRTEEKATVQSRAELCRPLSKRALPSPGQEASQVNSRDEQCCEESPRKRTKRSTDPSADGAQTLPRLPEPETERTTEPSSPVDSQQLEPELVTKTKCSLSKIVEPRTPVLPTANLPVYYPELSHTTRLPYSGNLPELSLSFLAPMTSPGSVASQDTVVSSQSTLVALAAPSPATSIRNTRDILVPNNALSHNNDNSSLRLPVPAWNLRVEEPPWRQLFEAVSSPSYARAPNKLDTHSWQLPPQQTPKISEDPPLPRVPALRFPWPSSSPRVTSDVNKPPLPAKPPVWAQSRQELCETLNYFRSYQGGVYSQKKRARGYLLDGHPSVHDLWHADGQLVISHAGGNSAVDKVTGQTVLINDQTEYSTSCAALLNSYKAKQAIVLIAGNGYRLFPYNLENRSYVVLGYYLITHAWEEPEPSFISPRGYFVRWKFMFQWIDAQGRPWWMRPAMYLPPPRPPPPPEAPGMTCPTCRLSSPRIYDFGWVCTHSNCASFFGRVYNETSSVQGYYPNFLYLKGEASHFQGILGRLQIRPRPPTEYQNLEDPTSRCFWKGWWCSKCGKLSCRERWTYWECSHCKNKLETPPWTYSANSVADSTAPRTFEVGKDSDIKTTVKVLSAGGFSYICQSFHLPRKRGVIHLIEGNDRANLTANEIFLQYQADAKNPCFFRRYSMKTHKLKGRMLSHYFSQNSGEPYKYVGGTDNTVPLDKYSSVKQAVTLIRERASLILSKDPMFNELLSAAYMVDQKMEFHSDGEKDLGPIVASLSLGSPAIMRFRPVPSKYAVPEPFDTPGRKTRPMTLTLTLQHGDVLIMEGAEIQEFYQHAVHPCGFRIAATARYINNMSPSGHGYGHDVRYDQPTSAGEQNDDTQAV